jgi:soluble P-type ATPase
MINIIIPGWGNMEIENLILDLNGTLSTDGEISPIVKEKLDHLSRDLNIYILTADTQGNAEQMVSDLEVTLVKVPEEGSAQGKLKILESLDPSRTVAIGNGNNDRLMLKEAALGILVLGEEGVSVSTLKDSDLLVKSISDALDLFLKPKRLIATLRE